MEAFQPLLFVILCLIPALKTVNARTLPQDSTSSPENFELGDIWLMLKNLRFFLESLNDESCKKISCTAFLSDQTHTNFRNFFFDLHDLLDEPSSETLKRHFHRKGRASTNELFHFLINATSPAEFKAFVHNTLFQPIHSDFHDNVLHRQKRGIISWLSDEASYLENKVENLDWQTTVKRAGQIYTVIQAARSVTDPSEMVMQAGLAVGKIMVSEMVEDKLNEWWTELTG